MIQDIDHDESNLSKGVSDEISHDKIFYYVFTSTGSDSRKFVNDDEDTENNDYLGKTVVANMSSYENISV